MAIKSRTRKAGNNKPGEPGRRPQLRLNPLRQAFFVGLAVAGIAIGYGVGILTETTPPPAKSESVSSVTLPPLLPEDTKVHQGKPVRAYEEALPQDIIESTETRPAVKVLRGTAEKTPSPDAQAASPPSPNNQDPARTKEAALAREKSAAPKTEAGIEPSPAKTESPRETASLPPAVPAEGKKARIVIVIDDLGIDRPRTARAIRLPGPLTMSFLTYAPDLDKQTRAAGDAGHELLLHIPMEPGSLDVDPGPNVLLTGIPRQELLTSLKWNLDQFTGYVGVNNHMGSRFTADLAGMVAVMEVLKKRNLFFLDSITAGNSVARKAARKIDVPFAGRNIFLDHADDVAGINKRLVEVEWLAKRTGLAIAIGHPREATLKALVPWLKDIENRGFKLVPLSSVVKPRRSPG